MSSIHNTAVHGALAILAAAALAACSEGSWFGREAEPPLPGRRISILAHEQTLAPDPQTAQNAILLPPPTVNPSWPQAGGYANHAMHHIAVGSNLQRAWSTNVGSGANDGQRLLATPIVVEDRVYTMDVDNVVTAVDAANGRKLWNIDLTPKDDDDGLFGGGLAFEDGRVYVTTGFAQVFALNPLTGQIIWRRTLDAPVHAAPTARGGRLFVVTVENKLYALDSSNGDQLWVHSGIGETASILGAASPAEDQGVVVVPYSSGELVALRVENGLVLWSESLAAVRRTDIVSTLADIRGRPIIDRGRVFAMSHGDMTVAIDLRSGQRIWEREIGGFENPWVAGPVLYALTNDQELVALNRDSGRVHWVTALPRWKNPEKKVEPILWTGPVLASDRLLVANSIGDVMAVSPYTGNIMGKVGLTDGVPLAPIVANGTVYFLTDDADLVAFR